MATASAFSALLAAGCGEDENSGNTLPAGGGTGSGSGSSGGGGESTIGFGPLVEDPAGLLDLPDGFSYRVLSRLGDLMDDGFLVPDRADGMGVFDLGGNRLALVRNHELVATQDAGGVLPQGFDRLDGGPVLPGGTTTIELDASTLEIVRQYRSLAGTIRNCSGGTTPWGTWLTCEEDVTRAGIRLGEDHGWVFEVPANAARLVSANPLRALGRFNHEAAAVDPASGYVYLTEDRLDGLLYRFLPDIPGQLAAGGRLQALSLGNDIGDTRNFDQRLLSAGVSYPASWIDVDDVESPSDDLRRRGAALGAALFGRGEGIFMGNGELYFTTTEGGPSRLGQVFRLRPRASGDTLELFFESDSRDNLFNGDNLAVAPFGDIIVCEDQNARPNTNHLRGIAPNGESYPFAKVRIQTEPAGVCFSPNGRTMFINLHSPTSTLAISGPFPT